MIKKDIFSIQDFAKFARTTRDTLLYYDKIGLLSPTSRGENNYRLYSHSQLSVINLIRTFKTLGMPLAQIKRLKNNRSPDLSDEILGNQLNRINEEIDALLQARNLLNLLKDTIHDHLDVDEEKITVRSLPERPIVLGAQNDYSDGKTDYDALYAFYTDCHDKYPGLDLNYPVWAQFSEKRILQRDWVWPDRYYFYGPEGYDKKPGGLYAIGYMRGGYGEAHKLYVRLIDYIEKNDLEICGPAYEEYPINEICALEEKDYLICVTIPVKTLV